MEWPTVVLILGILGTITTAIIKYVPQKRVHVNERGDRCATKQDLESLHATMRDHDRYTKERNHDLLNAISQIHANTITLMERTRLQRGRQNDDD